MKVQLYNVFADNYILQLAYEAEDYTISSNYVEIEDEKIIKVLNKVAEIADHKALMTKDKDLPFTKPNDTNARDIIFKCYNIIDTEILLSTLFKQEVKECGKVTAPAFIKPERYEYDKAGKRFQVSTQYVVLALAGWVLTKVIDIKDGKEVHMFMPNKDILYNLQLNLESGKLDILEKPETALSLLLASEINNVIDTVGAVKLNYAHVYIMKKKDPLYMISSGSMIELGKLLSEKGRQLLNRQLETFAKKALNEKDDMRTYYIRLVNYIYEYITGSRRIEDIIYFANRDLMLNKDSNVEKVKELKQVVNYVNNVLFNEALREGLI